MTPPSPPSPSNPSPSPVAIEPWWSEADLERAEVRVWRERFLGKGRRGLERWLERGAPYAADVQRVLREEGLPPELWVLTLLESGFELHAKSQAHAVGPWQFVPETARHVGLIVGSDRDERRDWERSTRGACGYLRELREELGDGLLALAAFNCGPSRLRGSARRNGVSPLWEIPLPPETRDYVPRFLALAAVVGTSTSLDGASISPPLAYERIDLPQPVGVDELARAAGTEPERIRDLNPDWLLPTTPGDGHPVRARVPAGTAERVRESIDRGELHAFRLTSERVHRVREGETLWGIARRYGVALRELLDLNGIRERDVLRAGRVLRLPG